MSEGKDYARRYAAWVDEHRWLILVAAVLLAAASTLAAMRLPIRPAVSYLLPRESRSVTDLEKLKQRIEATGTAHILVISDDPGLRARAAKLIYKRCLSVHRSLLRSVHFDDSDRRRYGWQHRFLFIKLKDLQEAHDALAEKIKKAKLKANPAYVDLEEDESKKQDEKSNKRIRELRDKLDDAEKKAENPRRFVTPDGRVQVISMRTATMSGTAASYRLVRVLRDIIAQVRREVGGDVKYGLTGTVPATVYEHEAILDGVTLAAIITLLLVAIGLYFYYRTVLPVVASLASCLVGTVFTLAMAYYIIGHLNLMTAFLVAIVVGNGINTGLMLLARYFEECRQGRPGTDGLGAAIGGALPGTLAAALTAGAAYLSLMVTEFRGFRHFGIIAGIGMIACWVSAFTVLPAALCVLRRYGRINVKPAPAVGRILARVVPRRLGVLLAGAGVVFVAAAGISAYYASIDPFLRDWDRLRSGSKELDRARHYDALMRPAVSTSERQKRFAIGLPSVEAARKTAAYMRKINSPDPHEQLFGSIYTIDSYLPKHQDKKLALLASIREMIEDDIVNDLDKDDRELIRRVTPPKDLRKLTMADVPAKLAWPFIERDGTRGRVIIASKARRFKTWNVDHRVAFAQELRKLQLPEGTLIGGHSLVIADIILSMRRDGPITILVAVLTSALAIFLIVGVGRHAVVTLLCVGFGMLVMVAMCALAGVRIHFMDLIAVPITIGIGADYAVNLVARHRQSEDEGPRHVLETTGGAVLLCSFTTMVGYGSLLLSGNGGIVEFGLAAILGEIACVGVALVVAPALLSYWGGRRTA